MEYTFSIPIWSYQSDEQKWKEKTMMNEEIHDYYPNEFRVLTYNIWFSNEYQPIRFQGLCDILKQSQADIIGLQEVTKATLDELLQQSFIQQHYFISDVDCRTFNSWYGVILLVSNRLHMKRMLLVDFPHSVMGRRLVMADIQIQPDELVRIGTVHLESLNNQQQRSEQLQICQNAFEKYSPETLILMGDFNFSDRNRENTDQFHILSKWIDVWTSLVHPDQYRYTFDTEMNLMIRQTHRHAYRSRYDRIIFHSRTIQPKMIDIIGKHQIAFLNHHSVFVSDHFGLIAIFRLTSTK